MGVGYGRWHSKHILQVIERLQHHAGNFPKEELERYVLKDDVEWYLKELE